MKRLILLGALGLVGCAGRPPQAFIDGYIGPCFPEDRDVMLSGPGGEIHLNNLDTDAGVLGGGRMGAFKPVGVVDLGAAIDVSTTTVDIEDLEMDILPLSLLAMLRVPLLKSEDRPHGILQPYIALGPSILMANATLEVPGFGTLRDSDSEVVLDFRAGMAVELYRKGIFAVAPFIEYRLLNGMPEFEEWGSSVETEVTAHCLLVGLSLRFGGG